LGLRRPAPDDEATLVRPLLDMLADQYLDFHLSFRHLTTFRPALLDSTSTQPFIDTLLGLSAEPQMLRREEAQHAWVEWLGKYAARLEGERALWEEEAQRAGGGSWGDARERAARGANPRFVLRQWLLEEVIKRVEGDAVSGRRVLAKVMQVRILPPRCVCGRRELLMRV